MNVLRFIETPEKDVYPQCLLEQANAIGLAIAMTNRFSINSYAAHDGAEINEGERLKAIGPMRQSSFGERAYQFYVSLNTPVVPRAVAVMNPYTEPSVKGYLKAFLNKYFDDDRGRIPILGINAGRFGAGVTGVTFTDPVALADECGIPNHLPRKRELSSIYIYDMIRHMGGPAKFYQQFFLSAVCPLGFTRKGVNLNYYDDRRLERAVTPFIVSSVERHIAFGCRRDHVVILGRGSNARFFARLNDEYRWFDEVHPVDHPRFIMQYRRKRLDEYLDLYASVLSGTV